MSLRATANALLVSSFLTGLAGIARCQSGLPAKSEVEGCLSERSHELILTDKDGDTYLLQSHAAELKALLGDELSVSGDIRDAAPESGAEYALGVVSFTTILRKNPAGVQPRLGDSPSWSEHRNNSYGIVMRIPESFPQQDDAGPAWGLSDFVDQSGIQILQDWDIPGGVYPGSNFKGGSFELSVDPAIRSAGTCLHFASETPGFTLSKTIGARSYAQTKITGAATGTADVVYHLHAFQNGFCYEFTFEFDEADGTGMEETCSLQWLTTGNEERLVESILSQGSFVAPEVKNSVRQPLKHPRVVSLRQSLPSDEPPGEIAVSWSTQGADYVQLRYPCIKSLFVSGWAGSEMKCGGPTSRNFPANGSERILFSNFNARAVRFVLTVEPFSDGKEYQVGSKAISFAIAPTPHPRSNDVRPTLP